MRAPILSLPMLCGALAMLACGANELHSATSLDPPDTDTFDPTDGNPSGGSYSTSVGSMTSADSGDTDGTTGGPTECEDANKRCAHDFTLMDDGYSDVAVFGDFASDGWEVGVPMAKDG